MDDELIVSGINTGIKLKDICEVSFNVVQGHFNVSVRKLSNSKPRNVLSVTNFYRALEVVNSINSQIKRYYDCMNARDIAETVYKHTKITKDDVDKLLKAIYEYTKDPNNFDFSKEIII